MVNFFKLKKILNHRRVIVTAGGTIEPMDPIRYIGNFSSGKMGIEIARRFRKYTKNVVLIYGNINIGLPRNIASIKVLRVEEMYNAIKNYLTDDALLIMAAAVSDFKVEKIYKTKIKKGKRLQLSLIPTIDILKKLAILKKPSNFFVGFAAESNNLIANAKKKLIEKRLDMVIANPVNRKNYPFGSDFNQVYIITKKSVQKLPLRKKEKIAKSIVRRITDEIQIQPDFRLKNVN